MQKANAYREVERYLIDCLRFRQRVSQPEEIRKAAAEYERLIRDARVVERLEVSETQPEPASHG